MKREAKFINIFDLINQEDPKKRTLREINNETNHKYNPGQLVEIESGARLFIIYQTRDCDGTPLYSLGIDEESLIYGYSEDSIELITKQKAEVVR